MNPEFFKVQHVLIYYVVTEKFFGPAHYSMCTCLLMYLGVPSLICHDTHSVLGVQPSSTRGATKSSLAANRNRVTNHTHGHTHHAPFIQTHRCACAIKTFQSVSILNESVTSLPISHTLTHTLQRGMALSMNAQSDLTDEIAVLRNELVHFCVISHFLSLFFYFPLSSDNLSLSLFLSFPLPLALSRSANALS